MSGPHGIVMVYCQAIVKLLSRYKYHVFMHYSNISQPLSQAVFVFQCSVYSPERTTVPVLCTVRNVLSTVT